jgi:cytochrome c biogenesis protein CcmG, thiol:disulfide interchange protein DsbE
MKWQRAVTAVAVAIPSIALLAFGLTRDPGSIPSPLPGRAAPAFALAAFTTGDSARAATLDSVRLAALSGDVVVLNFYASWCLACRDEHEVLRTVGARYAGTDVHFFGLLYNDSPENAIRWLGEMGTLPYPSLADPHSRTAIDYGLYGVPETFFIGRDGRVAYKHTGPVTADVLIGKIEQLRAASRVAAGGSQ